ncbi:MAG TPA: hypothetical protein DCL54_18200 [Alphaproteobacteria bacterium]|nr:hypothetical protein [Alphaproteobacteria bacterium]HAJ48513.1 hypothetical protein [Alphaproteobacteria bacterium]
MRDLVTSIHPLRAISPQSVSDNTALTSQIIDKQGYDSLTFVIATGSLADADATFAVSVEHGDQANLSDAAVAAAADLIGTIAEANFTFADDDETRKIGYQGAKRYVRIKITPANNSGAANLAAVAVLGHPHIAPTPGVPV